MDEKWNGWLGWCISGLITVLTVNYTQSQTSVYHPFPDSAATWYETTSESNTPCSAMCNYKLFVDGSDTIIGNITYNILYGQYLSSILGPIPCTCYPNEGAGPEIFRYIRHVTSEKKVYTLDPNTGNDMLLYDFNLQIGQSLSGYFVNSLGCPDYIVTSIDSVLVGNDYRKRLIFNGNDQTNGSVIEGIGSSFGLFLFCMGPGVTSTMTCFNQSDSLFFPVSTDGPCSPLQLTEMSLEINDINIYPNPGLNSVRVEWLGEHVATHIIIANLLGETIYSDAIGMTITVDLTPFPSGVYTVTVHLANGQVRAKKLVIQK